MAGAAAKLEPEQANAIIMAARAHWFADEPAKADGAGGRGVGATTAAPCHSPDGEAETGPLSGAASSPATVRPKSGLVRFVLAPDGKVVPDVAGKLPGRGLWLTARRDIVATRGRPSASSPARREQSVVVDDDLAERVEALLAQRCRDLIGLARRAGLGGRRVSPRSRPRSRAGRAAVLLAAADGGGGWAGEAQGAGAGLAAGRAF